MVYPIDECVMSTNLDDVKSQKGLKLINLNVRSVLNHFEEIESQLLDYKFDVVILSETWLSPNVTDSLISVNGYNMVCLDRQMLTKSNVLKKGGGLCVYIKDCYDYAVLTDEFVSNENLEMIQVVVKPYNQKQQHIFAVYRPPAGRLSCAIELLQQHLGPNRKGETTVIGDFNMDLLQSNCAQKRSLLQLFAAHSLDVLICSPTRITHRSATLIDIIASDVGYVSLAGTINVHMSDHLPVVLIKKKSRTERSYVEISGRSLRDFDVDAFKREVSSIDLDRLFTLLSNPSLVWDNLYTELVKIADCLCPVKTIKIYAYKSDYITVSLAEQIRDRDRAFRKVWKSKLPEDWSAAKNLRSTVRSALVHAKRDYVMNQIDLANGDGRKFWRTINKTFLKKSSGDINSVYKDGSDEMLYGLDAANEINNYFWSRK